MRFVYGDRAAVEVSGHRIAVTDIVEDTARKWFESSLRFLDPESHLVFQSELREGSAELVGAYGSESPRANDTSVGVGFAPVTETERLVVDAERFLNGSSLKKRFLPPGRTSRCSGCAGIGRSTLTVAIAFVDRFVADEGSYFEAKPRIREELSAYLSERFEGLDELEISINALDQPGNRRVRRIPDGDRHLGGVGRQRQVGRGNRLGGFTSATRPSSAEAVAGKNPRGHVGKIYNELCRVAAERIVTLDAVDEATVFLVSRIGGPLEDPPFGAVHLALAAGAALDDVRDEVEAAVMKTTAACRASWTLALDAKRGAGQRSGVRSYSTRVRPATGMRGPSATWAAAMALAVALLASPLHAELGFPGPRGTFSEQAAKAYRRANPSVGPTMERGRHLSFQHLGKGWHPLVWNGRRSGARDGRRRLSAGRGRSGAPGPGANALGLPHGRRRVTTPAQRSGAVSRARCTASR